MTSEALPVEHSVRCPAVAYRISAGGAVVFYAPDVAAIEDPASALSGVDLYVGDGASLTRPILRRQGRVRIGHAPVRDQIAWCARAGVPRALFTHCGTQIVAANARSVSARVRAWGRAHALEAGIARDGLVLEVAARTATLSGRLTPLAAKARRDNARRANRRGGQPRPTR